jgi:hypothetical protein
LKISPQCLVRQFLNHRLQPHGRERMCVKTVSCGKSFCSCTNLAQTTSPLHSLSHEQHSWGGPPSSHTHTHTHTLHSLTKIWGRVLVLCEEFRERHSTNFQNPPGYPPQECCSWGARVSTRECCSWEREWRGLGYPPRECCSGEREWREGVFFLAFLLCVLVWRNFLPGSSPVKRQQLWIGDRPLMWPVHAVRRVILWWYEVITVVWKECRND